MTSEARRPQHPRVVEARGPRACEQALLTDLERHLTGRGAEALTRPTYLIVPSHSLRFHLLGRLMQERGRSVAGLACWTLHSLAMQLLERAGRASPPGDILVPVLARRLAARQRPLREALEHLRQGYAVVATAVRDLLEAGLDPAHGEALEEALGAEGAGASRAEVRRARSLVRVATGTRLELEELGLVDTSSLLSQATEVLRCPQPPPFPVNAMFLHGFADATGVATDFIQALQARFAATLYLDRPPDPADPGRDDAGVAFSRRFSERLRAMTAAETRVSALESTPVRLEIFQALGVQAEVREVAARLRRLLDEGAAPETMGVVMRRPQSYRTALRTQLWRLGIPFSAVGILGPHSPSGRQVRGLLELMAGGQDADVDRWLDLRGETIAGVEAFDLRLALFGFGAARLREVAELDLERLVQGDRHPLPARLGFSAPEEEESGARLGRRRIPAAVLKLARSEARRLGALFVDWERSRALREHLSSFAELLRLLGWSAGQPAFDLVHQAVARRLSSLPGGLELEFEELRLLLEQALDSVGLERLGGRGGGVQVLDVIEARGRTFEQLFLLGLNRGVFPRPIREDPVLPDTLRQVLGRHGHGPLPDLATKLGGHAEERFLFAQLLSSSPRVTLSWLLADDDGRELTPSPLVERLLWAPALRREGERPEPPVVRSPLAPPLSGEPRAVDEERLRTLDEQAIRAALWGTRQELAVAFELALSGAEPRLAGWQPEIDLAAPADVMAARRVAPARLRILAEHNRSPGRGARLGPYFGWVGVAKDGDPRLTQELYVTVLEGLAVCPWRTFLHRLLRLEPLPDPVDLLPGLEPLLVGRLVHRSLERVVAERLESPPISIQAARQHEPREVPWPSRASLLRTLESEAAFVARDHGIGWEGFAGVLARVALPYLEVARQLAWEPIATNRPVGVELEGSLAISARALPSTLHFRADRLDRTNGGLLLSDYKTGRRGISDAKQASTRRRHLLEAIRSGRLLQAVAYTRADGGTQDCGRYLYVRPDFAGSDESRAVQVAADDAEAQAAFDAAVSALLEAWRVGCFFPRLVEADADREPTACEYCTVAEACLRGDSGARGRLRDWAAQRRDAPVDEASELPPLQAALLEVWRLGSKKALRESV